MKKLISLLLAMVLAISLMMSVSAKGNEINVYLDGYSGSDGQKINFDVPPQSINDRTMVPIRAIFEAMGATVSWDDAAKTVLSTKDSTTVTMTLNSTTGYINDTAFEMDVTPIVIDGRTLVPARYVAEAFGYHVNWDSMTQSVLISKDTNFDVSQVKDGSRKHPYTFGDSVQINVYKLLASEPKATFDITLKKLLSPQEMEEKINNSDYFTYDENQWYLNCYVSLSYYESDSAYNFGDFIIFENKFVTNNGTTQNAISWYKDPSKYTHLELFEGGSAECYIPIDLSELSDGETIEYYTISTLTGNPNNPNDKKTVWFSLK